MAVLKLEPYLFYVKNKKPTTIDTRTGDPVQSQEGGDDSPRFKCDMVPSGGAPSELTAQDGTKVSYSNVLYCYHGAPIMRVGQEIIVLHKEDESIAFQGTIKGFHRYQLQTKIWV